MGILRAHRSMAASSASTTAIMPRAAALALLALLAQAHSIDAAARRSGVPLVAQRGVRLAAGAAERQAVLGDARREPLPVLVQHARREMAPRHRRGQQRRVSLRSLRRRRTAVRRRVAGYCDDAWGDATVTVTEPLSSAACAALASATLAQLTCATVPARVAAATGAPPRTRRARRPAPSCG